MKKHGLTSVITLSALVGLGLSSGAASAMDIPFSELNENLQKGCPAVWEDPALPIDLTLALGSLFSSELVDIGGEQKTDIQWFKDFYRQTNEVLDPDTNAVIDPVTDAELNVLVANKKAISLECNSHRKNFLDQLLATNSLDSAAALEAATGVADAIDFSSRNWRVGDVRVTGRAVPEEGWLFPTGQTIGAAGSQAQLSDDQYQDLFELAKNWAPNIDSADAPKVWGASGSKGVVVLPDMRGRAVFAADNMSGVATGQVPEANKIGAVFGDDERTITTAELPSHNHSVGTGGGHAHAAANGGQHKHTMNAVGNHSHTTRNAGQHGHSMGVAGNHGHSLRTSTHTGSGGARSDLPYFEGRARPNYQNNIPSSVQKAGNHSHSLSQSGNHSHTVNAGGAHTPTMQNSAQHTHAISATAGHSHSSATVGGGEALKTVSPGITMNVEIKY